MHLDIKTSPNIVLLDIELKKLYCIAYSPGHYNFGNRSENIIHCQLRNNASNLNSHIYNHHLSETKVCPFCNSPDEDNYHYLFVCSKFSTARSKLLESVKNINVDISLNLFLNGDADLSIDNNTTILCAVHLFIKQSKRFF